ncbi:MAG TPA: glycosyltransferase [Solirubrobacteraceae bacterium]|nr:glycosyltransferase [Solirubrobacteraceae bacterium]
MRICVVYDCLFPHTVGGAERWYRNLAERLAAEGHEVTYLTLRQWERGERVQVPGVRVLSVGPRLGLYTADGRRRIWPPLVFGAGVLWHLLRHGRRYEAVHSASFPYFSLLAAALARPLGRYRLVVDWHEVWSDSYWREYLGPIGGPIGALVQRLCARARQHAFCFSELHARRLRGEGLRGEVTMLRGEYSGSLEPTPARPAAAAATVVFAGRLIPEKRAPLAVAALARATESIAGLRGELYGDGPEREAVREAIAAEGLSETVSAPGFVAGERIEQALGEAMCMLSTSRREGYGLIVVEAAARGTPSVVVAGEDNAATELIEEGVNGFVAPDADPRTIAAAIVRVHEAGTALRQSTAGWFAANARRLSLEDSLRVVLGSYSGGASADSEAAGPSARA